MKTLVIASGNAGKIREFEGLLNDLPVTVQPQPAGLEVEETGSTFAANARLKAQAVAAWAGHRVEVVVHGKPQRLAGQQQVVGQAVTEGRRVLRAAFRGE